MSKHDPRVSLRQIVECAEKAEVLIQDVTYQQFLTDWRTQLVAERLIEIMGEAANCIPEELHEEYPAIPWRQMIGTRNWLAHGYDAIDYQIIWDVLTNHASTVRTQALLILADIESGLYPP